MELSGGGGEGKVKTSLKSKKWAWLSLDGQGYLLYTLL